MKGSLLFRKVDRNSYTAGLSQQRPSTNNPPRQAFDETNMNRALDFINKQKTSLKKREENFDQFSGRPRSFFANGDSERDNQKNLVNSRLGTYLPPRPTVIENKTSSVPKFGRTAQQWTVKDKDSKKFSRFSAGSRMRSTKNTTYGSSGIPPSGVMNKKSKLILEKKIRDVDVKEQVVMDKYLNREPIEEKITKPGPAAKAEA